MPPAQAPASLGPGASPGPGAGACSFFVWPRRGPWTYRTPEGGVLARAYGLFAMIPPRPLRGPRCGRCLFGDWDPLIVLRDVLLASGAALRVI